MSFVYFLSLIGLSVTCYRLHKCFEIMEYNAEPGIAKNIYKIMGIILIIPALPYTLIFISLEVFEYKQNEKRHLQELRLVHFLASLHTWPTKVDCAIYGLTPISDHYKETGDFEVWRDRVYEDLGL